MLNNTKTSMQQKEQNLIISTSSSSLEIVSKGFSTAACSKAPITPDILVR